MKKIYRVNFRKYTNHLKNTVWDGNDYVNAKYNDFLISEDDIDKIKDFGDGISTMEFVGYLYED